MKKILKRNEIDPKFKWKIEDLYINDECWNESYDKTKKAISDFEKDSRTITTDNLFDCLKQRDQIYSSVERLYVYANLRANEDSTNTFYAGIADRAENLITVFSKAVSFIEPAILALDPNELKAAAEKQPLCLYKHYINDILRSREHILTADKEEIIAQVNEVANSPSNIFYMLNNADMKFPDAADSNGDMHTLTHGKYIPYLESSDRVLRKSAFDNLYDTYFSYKNTLAAIYNGSVKSNIFTANVRNYQSSLKAHLEPNAIPTEVYHSLIETVNKYLPLMHRYIKLRKKMLGVEELHMYDLYTPIVKKADTKISYEDAVDTIINAVAPLGEEYTAVFEKGLRKEGWVDIYENQGKRSGAYSWGVQGCHPFVSMNYEGTIDSMFTLIHEMGHSMHSYYTWENQPTVYADYTIFVAEVASTCNEALLMEYLLENTADQTQRLYLINYFMEQFRGTLFRQTMFAEFELEVHNRAEKGEPITFDLLCDIYKELNKKYFGSDIVIDEKISWEWARIPHFYTAFYVYQYATGYSAAIALSQKILKENGRDAYINFLKSGSSKYSIDLLKDAGVDMTTPEPVENAMRVFEGLLDSMEGLG